MKFIKYLILSGCFFISTVWANKGVFVELTSRVIVSPYHVVLTAGGGMGYKYNSPNENYFGYFQGSLNLNTYVFPSGSIFGHFNFEYGYEFNRDSSFSYGVSVSPLIFWISRQEVSFFSHLLGVFGNIKINDSFLISIEGKSIMLDWDYFIGSIKEIDLFPLSIEVNGKYFF